MTLNTPAHWILVVESPRKTQWSQALDGTMLYLEKRQIKMSFKNMLWSNMASESLPANVAGQLACAQPSGAAEKGPRALPVEDRHNTGVGQVPYDACASRRDKGTFTEPETSKDIPTQGD